MQIVSVAANSVAHEMSSIEQLSMEMALRLSDIETLKDEEGRKHRLNLETQVSFRQPLAALSWQNANH